MVSFIRKAYSWTFCVSLNPFQANDPFLYFLLKPGKWKKNTGMKWVIAYLVFAHNCQQVSQEWFVSRYSRIDQIKFVEDSLWSDKIWSDMVCLGRHFIFFKGCLLQTLLGLFLNTLTHFCVYAVFYCVPPLVNSAKNEVFC